MAMFDPKSLKKPAENTEDETAQLRAMITALQAQVEAIATAATASSPAFTPALLEEILTRTATASAIAAQDAAKHENEQGPGISVFSYPEGDVLRPRALKCRMLENGYQLDIDVLSWREVELYNAAEPGTYEFHRTDGSRAVMTVEADRAPDGAVSTLRFSFPTKEQRETLPSIVSRLREAFGVRTPEQIELDKLRSEVEALRAKQTVAV